ncbi:hypothetical protein COBT_002042 [Conglomerata obtusa]
MLNLNSLLSCLRLTTKHADARIVNEINFFQLNLPVLKSMISVATDIGYIICVSSIIRYEVVDAKLLLSKYPPRKSKTPDNTYLYWFTLYLLAGFFITM